MLKKKLSKEARSAMKKEEYLIQGINAALEMLRLRKQDRNKVHLANYKKWAGFSERMLAHASKGLRMERKKKPFRSNGLDATEGDFE